jgi:hypothetical protein
VHPDTVRGWIRTCKFQAINLCDSAANRIKKSVLDRFLEERMNTTQSE